MVARSGLFVAPLPGSPPQGTSPTDGRLVLGALFGTGGGCLSGGSLTASATAMQVTVAAAVWRIPDPSNGAAVFLSPADSAVLTFAAGPASGSRIDVIWVKQDDYGNGDADSRVVYGVTAGTASATPTAPALLSGQMKIGQLTVPTGASNAAACTLVAPYSGQSLLPPVRAVVTEAQLPASGDYVGQLAYVAQVNLGTSTVPIFERWSGTAWQRWESDWVAYAPGQLGMASATTGGFYRYHAGRVAYEFVVTSTGAGSSGILLVGLPVNARQISMVSGSTTTQSGWWATGRANIYAPSNGLDYDCAIGFNANNNIKFGLVNTGNSGVLTANQSTPVTVASGLSIRGYLEYDPA